MAMAVAKQQADVPADVLTANPDAKQVTLESMIDWDVNPKMEPGSIGVDGGLQCCRCQCDVGIEGEFSDYIYQNGRWYGAIELHSKQHHGWVYSLSQREILCPDCAKIPQREFMTCNICNKVVDAIHGDGSCVSCSQGK